jgi:hypothetical protein
MQDIYYPEKFYPYSIEFIKESIRDVIKEVL